MKGEKGSILVGVIGLCLAMSIAAGGFLLFSTNTAKDGLASATDLQLQYAAESGLELGIRWTRIYPFIVGEKMNDPLWNPRLVLTRGASGFDLINDRWVKVILDTLSGSHCMISMATRGANFDTLVITQIISSVTTGPGGLSPYLSTPVLGNRTQTFRGK